MALPTLTRPRADRGEGLTRRPWAIVLLCLLAAAAVATPVAVLDLHGRHDLPDAPPTGGHPRVTVLDALARVTTPPPPLARSVAQLSLERKVAQLFMVGFAGTSRDAKLLLTLRTRDWGGVVLQNTNFSSDQGVRELVAALQQRARRARDQPLLVAAAQEGGDRRALPDLPPTAQPTIARRGVRALRREAGRAGSALRKLGIRMTLAPLADVPAEGGPFVPRAFGLDAGFVTRAVGAAVGAYLRAGVIPAVGAFPRRGRRRPGSRRGPGAGRT